MKIYRLAGAVLFSIVLISGCSSNEVSGNGNQVTKSRSVEAFNQIEVDGAYDVDVVQGSENSVELTTDSNIAPLVLTTVDDNNLEIKNKTGVSFKVTHPVHVKVIVKKLTRLVASGSNQVSVSGLTGDGLSVETNGSIKADLAGNLKMLSLRIAGNGEVDASKLVAEEVAVRLLGSGHVQVNVLKTLDTKITGNGSIQYAGKPDEVKQSITGSGTIVRVG